MSLARVFAAVILVAALTAPLHAAAMGAPAPAQAHTAAVRGTRGAAAASQPLAHRPVALTTHLYRVLQGDNVTTIARRFHDMTWLLRRRNGGLQQLAPGALIWVWDWPFDTPSWIVHSYRSDKSQVYIVRSGDTLSVIAVRLGVSVQTLADANNLGDGDLIYPGQRLVLHHVTWHTQQTLVPPLSGATLPRGLLLTDIAAMVDIDPALLKAMAWHESGWRMVRGHSGEIGMVQIMPEMARWVQKQLIGYPLNPHAPVNNALEGALLLAYYLDTNHQDAARALSMYHSGYTLLDNRNRTYIQAVLALRKYFAGHPHAGF